MRINGRLQRLEAKAAEIEAERNEAEGPGEQFLFEAQFLPTYVGRQMLEEIKNGISAEDIMMTCDDRDRAAGWLSICCWSMALRTRDLRLPQFLNRALSSTGFYVTANHERFQGFADTDFLRARQYCEDSGDDRLRSLAIALRNEFLDILENTLNVRFADQWNRYGVRIRLNHPSPWGIHKIKTVIGDMPYGGPVNEAIVDLDTAEKLIKTNLWSFVEEWIPDGRQTETNVG